MLPGLHQDGERRSCTPAAQAYKSLRASSPSKKPEEVSVGRIRGDEPERNAPSRRLVDQVKSDLDLRLLLDLGRNVRAPLALLIGGPIIWQEEPTSDRPMHWRGGSRSFGNILGRDDGLAVGSFAEFAAVLVGHATECLPFLGKVVSSMASIPPARLAPTIWRTRSRSRAARSQPASVSRC